jgi:hypothetical protein
MEMTLPGGCFSGYFQAKPPVVMFSRHLPDKLLQTVLHRPNKHLAPLLGTPDDVVHDKVFAILLLLIIQVAIMAFFNTERKPEGPFIPRLKPRGFLAIFCNWRVARLLP